MSARPVSSDAFHPGDEEVEIVEGVLDAEAHERRPSARPG